MQSVSTRLDDETERLVREMATERDVSMAEVLREMINKGIAYDELQQETEEHITELEQENERLQRRVEKLIAIREEHGELVEYVEREKSLQERRENRLKRADAPIWKRGYWWVFGQGEQDALASDDET